FAQSHLDILSRTLSAGEAQRVKLASLLGAELTGVTVLLDEPTRGLHPRDADPLGGALRAHGASATRGATRAAACGPPATPSSSSTTTRCCCAGRTGSSCWGRAPARAGGGCARRGRRAPCRATA